MSIQFTEYNMRCIKIDMPLLQHAQRKYKHNQLNIKLTNCLWSIIFGME